MPLPIVTRTLNERMLTWHVFLILTYFPVEGSCIQVKSKNCALAEDDEGAYDPEEVQATVLSWPSKMLHLVKMKSYSFSRTCPFCRTEICQVTDWSLNFYGFCKLYFAGSNTWCWKETLKHSRWVTFSYSIEDFLYMYLS